jgi:hypothetical protein
MSPDLELGMWDAIHLSCNHITYMYTYVYIDMSCELPSWCGCTGPCMPAFCCQAWTKPMGYVLFETQASVCGEQPFVNTDDLSSECWINTCCPLCTAVECVECVEGVRCGTLRTCPNVARLECRVTLAEMLYWTMD